MERKDMSKEIWVIEANLDSVDPFEYRVTTSECMLEKRRCGSNILQS